MSGTTMHMTFADAAIGQHLARLAQLDAGHFGAIKREIGEFMVADIQDNLDGQKLFDGRAMPQSAAAIQRTGKTLIKDHHLYDSYVFQAVDQGIELGSEKVYARIHHEGGMAGRGHKTKIVARPVMGMGMRQERGLGDLLINEIRALQ
jgi:phage gpG-like protein